MLRELSALKSSKFSVADSNQTKFKQEYPVWKDLFPRRLKQANRKTLLEFISHLLIGFKKLDNHQVVLFVEQYFSLKNTGAIEQQGSTKNISYWPNNDAPLPKGKLPEASIR